MSPRDKYTTFVKSAKGYRKGIHKVPKFTRVRIRYGSGLLSLTHITSSLPCGRTRRVSKYLLPTYGSRANMSSIKLYVIQVPKTPKHQKIFLP
jgi:hypothetical protein